MILFWIDGLKFFVAINRTHGRAAVERKVLIGIPFWCYDSSFLRIQTIQMSAEEKDTVNCAVLTSSKDYHL